MWKHLVYLPGQPGCLDASVVQNLLPLYDDHIYNTEHSGMKLTHWPLGDLNAILKNVIFNLVLLIGIFRSSHDNALSWMPQDLADDKSTLVQVMAWCHQATSHYLSQCWLSSLSPYGVARPFSNAFSRMKMIEFWFQGTLWNSTQNILPIHCKIRFLYSVEILWALGFKSS